MIPRWFPNVQDPADGNFIEKHIQCISKNISCKILFVKGLKKDPPEPSIVVEKHENLNYELHYFKLRQGFLSSLLNTLTYWNIQFRYFKRLRKKSGLPVITHAHVTGRSCLLPFYLKLRHKIPYIISEHWSGYYEINQKISPLKRLSSQFFLKRADKISAVSLSLASAINKLVPGKQIDIIPNIVDDVFFSSVSSEKSKPKQFIHISNFIKEVKQSDQILQTFEELFLEGIQCKLLMVGDGKDRTEMEKLVQQSDLLKKHVQFTGDIDQAALAVHLKASAACISFSKFETQSIVLLESISMGIPVIAPRIGGIPEHCENKGILFDVNNRDEFKLAVKKMIEKDMEENSSEWTSYARGHFSCTEVGKKFVEMYRKLKPDLDVQ